jgi:hypothetical protein
MDAGDRMRLEGAIALLRKAWRNDGAEGESVHLVCRFAEHLAKAADETQASFDAAEVAWRARVVARDEILEAVRVMRERQRAWFGGDKSRETLAASKVAERRVDKLLEALDAGPPAQGALFR